MKKNGYKWREQKEKNISKYSKINKIEVEIKNMKD